MRFRCRVFAGSDRGQQSERTTGAIWQHTGQACVVILLPARSGPVWWLGVV